MTSIYEAAAWRLSNAAYIAIQSCDDGWDYTLLDRNRQEIDGGQLDAPELSLLEARDAILEGIDPAVVCTAQFDYGDVL